MSNEHEWEKSNLDELCRAWAEGKVEDILFSRRAAVATVADETLPLFIRAAAARMLAAIWTAEVESGMDSWGNLSLN